MSRGSCVKCGGVLVTLLLALAVATGSVDASPGETEAAPEGRLAVTYIDQNHVSVYDLDGTTLATIPTGLSPRGMAVRDGRLFVANRGPNQAPGSSITVIDLDDLEPERTIYACVACAPYEMVFDPEDRLWFTGQADRTVYQMTPPYDGPDASVMVAWGWPTQLALVDGMGTLAIAMRNTEDTALIDTRTLDVERLPIGSAPGAVSSRPGYPEAWFAVAPVGFLARVTERGDAGRPDTEVQKIDSFPAEVRFLPDGERLLVTVGQPLSVALYDAESMELLDRVSVDSRPGAMSLAPDGQRVAVLIPFESQLVRFRISEERITEETSFEVDGEPARVLWIP